VRLGVEHSSSKTSGSQEETSSNTDNNGSPDGEEWGNNDLSLLSSVGEVVVSRAHVPELSSLVHSDESSIEVLWGSVELHAVLGVSLNGVLVVVVLLLQVLKRQAVGLSEHAHPLSQSLGLEQWGVLGNPLIRSGDGSVKVGELYHVGSVSSCSSFSSISSWVGVASSPLEVDVVSSTSSEEGGDEVVLSRWVGLHDVSSLSSDVQVEDSLKRRDSLGSGSDVEHVRSVLEGSSELRSINGKRHVKSILGNVWVLFDGGVGSVGSPVNESSVGSVSSRSQVVGGDVVTDSQHAVAVVVLDAVEVLGNGESPVEASLESIDRVTQMVVSRPGSLDADGGWDFEGWDFSPFVSSSKASWLRVLSLLLSIVTSTEESGLDVLRFLLVEVAPSDVLSQDGNVSPGGWGPIRIIISLFGAFKSVSVSIVVLSGVDCSVSVQVSLLLSVSNEESLVSLSCLASSVVVSVLVHSVSQKSSSVLCSGNSIISVGDGISCNSVTNSLLGNCISSRAHVLDDNVAVQLVVLSTAVLNSPFNGQQRTFVVRHGWTIAVASLSVVLGVEQTIGIISVLVCFVQTVIRTSGIVHVAVSKYLGN